MEFEIFKYESVTSTNDVAINLIRQEHKKAGCVYADLQTKGRGTHGREWISDKGNLFSSIFFPLENNYPPFNEFSIINPIIISDVIKHFCDGRSINLKFPNDIFINKEKICGLLQETVISSNRKFLIIGIGINIISSPNIKGEYRATNIFLQTKKKLKIEEVINLIISSYAKFLTDLNSYNYENFRKKAELLAMNQKIEL